MSAGHTPGPWLGVSANGGGPTIKVGGKWVRATPADVAAMKASRELLEALVNLRASILIHLPTTAALFVEREIKAASDAIAKATEEAA